ncbi:putative zinc finger, CCHC-type containing protein [Tanacetum coccineum]
MVQVYVDDIIFGSTKKELYIAFEKLMHEKFQMSSLREVTFFLGLQVKQKKDGIFISQDKYVAEILKKFRFIEVKTASTPMETQKPLLKDEDGEEVDVHMYRLQSNTKRTQCWCFYAGASLHRKSTTGDEVVHKELGDSLERAGTTTSSLEAEQDSGVWSWLPINMRDFYCSKLGLSAVNLSEHSNDSPLVRGQTLRSDKDRLKLNELMDIRGVMPNNYLMYYFGDIIDAIADATALETLTLYLEEMKSTRPKRKGLLYKSWVNLQQTISSHRLHHSTITGQVQIAKSFDWEDLEDIFTSGGINLIYESTTTSEDWDLLLWGQTLYVGAEKKVSPFTAIILSMMLDKKLIIWSMKGTEFLNKTLNAFFKEERIEHQTSTPRTPEQNGVVERRNCTLIEAARTMLLASKLPLFFWAEAIATTCYTQNRSIIIPTHEKTAYHIINDMKPLIKHLYIFGCTCYLTRDGENLDKMKEKRDPCILVGYSTQSKGYRVYNKRTRLIFESIHLRFDEIKAISETFVANNTSGLILQRQKASDYDNSGPAPQLQNVSPSADTTAPSQQELDLLFDPLYDEFFNVGISSVNKSSSPTDNSKQQDTSPTMNIQSSTWLSKQRN